MYLSQAFQSVDHSLLLFIIRKIVFISSASTWFHDYLSDRQQSVNIATVPSDFFLELTKSVPQDSIFGPVLFIIDLNHIIPHLTNCHVNLYTDDTILHCIADSAGEAVNNLQHSFSLLQAALVDLKRVLIAPKTKLRHILQIKNLSSKIFIISTVQGPSIQSLSI